MISIGNLKSLQVHWLGQLDGLVQNCERCRLFEGGRAKPYWTKYSRYAIIGESPWTDEVQENEPFFGTTGKLLWKYFKKLGLCKKDFLILNSVNCRPLKNRNRKPTTLQVKLCHRWIRLYLLAVQPSKILILGNYAKGSFLGDFSGITGEVGYKFNYKLYDKKIPCMLCVHPSYAIYNEEVGNTQLLAGLKIFSKMR